MGVDREFKLNKVVKDVVKVVPSSSITKPTADNDPISAIQPKSVIPVVTQPCYSEESKKTTKNSGKAKARQYR